MDILYGAICVVNIPTLMGVVPEMTPLIFVGYSPETAAMSRAKNNIADLLPKFWLRTLKPNVHKSDHACCHKCKGGTKKKEKEVSIVFEQTVCHTVSPVQMLNHKFSNIKTQSQMKIFNSSLNQSPKTETG